MLKQNEDTIKADLYLKVLEYESTTEGVGNEKITKAELLGVTIPLTQISKLSSTCVVTAESFIDLKAIDFSYFKKNPVVTLDNFMDGRMIGKVKSWSKQKNKINFVVEVNPAFIADQRKVKFGLTKKEFLKRCENAYDMGLANEDMFRHLSRAYDAMHRLEGNQFEYFAEYIIAEQQRTEHFANRFQLANDTLGYSVIQFLAIFTHPCQICATDKDAWHTRAGFCPHRRILEDAGKRVDEHGWFERDGKLVRYNSQGKLEKKKGGTL